MRIYFYLLIQKNMANLLESVVEGFESKEFSELINETIEDCLCEPSQRLFNSKWFSELNNKNKLYLFKLIVECYQYFDEKECDSRTQSAINKYINMLSFINDPCEREKTRKNINKIINEFRQCKDDKFVKDFIDATSNRIYFILNKSRMHMNLAFGVATLIRPHAVLVEMENVIDEFLKNHPEYYEIILNGQLGMHVHDGEYKYETIKKTERYLRNRIRLNPDDEVYKILHELFEMFVESEIKI